MPSVPCSRYWCFGLLALAGVTSDLVSKALVFSELGAPRRSSDWFCRTNFLWGRFEFRLTTVFNEGALFGIGQGYSWLFAALSIAAALGILYWLFVRGEARSWWLTITLGLILSGALGNLYDRLHLHGWTTPDGAPQYGVRDFLDCTIPWISVEWPLRARLVAQKEWPVFNFADMYLVSGALMLTVYSFVTPGRKDVSGQPPNGSSAAAGPPAGPGKASAGA